MAHAVGDTITLNLYNPTRPTEIELTDMGYWSETYNNSDDFRFLEFDLFSFTHIPTGFGGADVGGNMSYWDGFTYCTSGDTTDYGALGSSDGWVSQQWGCMAGGGIVTDDAGMVMKDEQGKVMTQPGIPYLVAYWGYWVEMNEEGDPCLQVNFTDDNAYKAIGTYICNNPWPYYGNIHGDGFASPFDKDGDCYKLIAHGMNEEGESTGVRVTNIWAEFNED